MYKNQLQELAQRSCFSLPSYSCIREGPDHAPRFKATVNFNGEVFESPSFCTTLRQAEHAAAEVALNALSSRGPSHSLAARILDETGVYKNLLQEVAQRVGAPLPSYTTVHSGHGHRAMFLCTVELAEILFTGEPAKSKKQAEKNAAMASWNSLKQLARQEASSLSEPENNDELEQITVARALLNYRLKEKIAMANNPNAQPFPKKFLVQSDKKPSLQQASCSGSKILPMIQPRSAPRIRPTSPTTNEYRSYENYRAQPRKFPAGGAAPYIPRQHFRTPYGVAAPVTIRTAIPVFSAPPLSPLQARPLSPLATSQTLQMAQPVVMRQAVPVFAAPTLFPSQIQIGQMQAKEHPPAVPGVDAQTSGDQTKDGIFPNAVASVGQFQGETSQVVEVHDKEVPASVAMAKAKEQHLVAASSDPTERNSVEAKLDNESAAKCDGQDNVMLEKLRTLDL